MNTNTNPNTNLIATTKVRILGWIICSLAAIFYCYELVLRVEPSVMVPELMKAFQVNATELGVFAAVYYFIYTPMQVIVGLLSDLYGPRRILTLAVLSCAAGSFIFGTAHSLQVAVIGRFLIGFGSAFAFVGVLKLAANWLPERFFTFFVGLATALGMLGGMLADVVFSSLVHSMGWKAAIAIGTVIGFILTPLIWFIVKDHPTYLQPGSSREKNKPEYSDTFTGLWQIIKNSQMWLNGVIGCLMYLALSLFAELWGISFLTKVYNLSQHQAATTCSMVFFGWLVGGPLSGYISDYFRLRRILVTIGCLFSAITISVIIYVPNISLGTLYILLFIFGIFSSFEVIAFTIGRENSPSKLVATAAAFTNFLIMMGGIIAQPLIGKILDVLWAGAMVNGIREYSVANYRFALTVLPIGFLLGFVLSFLLKETQGKIKEAAK